MRTLNQETLRQMELYIREYQKGNGKSPSYRNIMHAMGMSSLNLVQRYVIALERDGRIQRTQLGNIELPPQFDRGEIALAPLVGSIACGDLSTEIEHIEDTFALPRSLFGGGELIILHARGNSMKDAGIDEGDVLVIRRQEYAEDGEIVVALANEQNTLKRLFHRNGKIVLHPENKELKDIIVDSCKIQGVLVSCIKMY